MKVAVKRREFLGGLAVAGLAGASVETASAATMAPKIQAQEFWAQKGDVKLYIYRKFQGSPKNKPVLFLVHGSSFSGRGGFDLHVPGKPGYSFMDEFAKRGYDVWTMDHENYGRSSKTNTNSDVRSGADDLKAAMPIVERETGKKSFMFYSQSSGALRLGLMAMEKPEYIDRMVLDAFTYTGEGAPEIMRRRREIKTYQASNFRKSTVDTFKGIFSRDDPKTVDPAVPLALADYEMKLTDRTPNGTYIDMAIHMPIVDPKKLLRPVLITRAEHDGNATDEELLNFFGQLPNRDKQFAMIKGIAHIGVLGIYRQRIWHVMDEFWTMPEDAQA